MTTVVVVPEQERAQLLPRLLAKFRTKAYDYEAICIHISAWCLK